MNRYLINIKFIPKKIKLEIIKNIYCDLQIVGYKKIHNGYKIPIVQFPNKKRIWILNYEIQTQIKNIK
uniref:Cytochrome b6-f complex subunit PetP n=1 Tax=Thaumatella adunca TaxID=2006976 RepID=A0A1Z1MN45_9FLOR|nr:cytochrome b6-f complex subunit PetP [Thaumatella adunca]ARW67468.1 cytochrome b6-f complex subunit PetP [Thaumatella adunca]